MYALNVLSGSGFASDCVHFAKFVIYIHWFERCVYNSLTNNGDRCVIDHCVLANISLDSNHRS
jgi:hypothetical protein